MEQNANKIFDFIKSLPEGMRMGLHLDGLVSTAQKILPWFDLNLGWVVPALVGLALGLAIRAVRKNK